MRVQTFNAVYLAERKRIRVRRLKHGYRAYHRALPLQRDGFTAEKALQRCAMAAAVATHH